MSVSKEPTPPYGLLIWANRVVDNGPHHMIFDGMLHNDEECRHGTHWGFQFSGDALFLSEEGREIAKVELSLGHTTRGGFFVALEGHRPAKYPVLITDALETQAGPFGKLRFAPADASVEWAGALTMEGWEEAKPIYCGVLSDGWFGVIQFTSVDTAYVITYSTSRLPTAGDELWFTHDHERIGRVFSFDAIQE